MNSAHAGGEERFRDNGTRLWSFAEEILVCCPRCGERAVVTPHRDHPVPPGSAIEMLVAPHRLICPGCAHIREWAPQRGTPAPGGGSAPIIVPELSGPDDPYFGLPLWLQRPCRGRVLWAYNRAHLDLLERFVASPLRESGAQAGSDGLVQHLPRWIKATENRAEVLAAVRALRRYA